LIAPVGDRTPRIVSTTNRKVTTVEDMKGLKMRIPGAPIFKDVFEYWKAVPTPTKGSEIMMSLKSGLVDGQDNGISGIGNLGPTPLKHVTPINWMRSGIGLFISEITWQKLSEQEREWVSEAAVIAGKAGVAQYESVMDKAWKRLDAMDVEVTKPDLSGFLPVTQFIVDKYEGDWWPQGWVQRIREIE